jgi:WD40 repeat protein
MLSAAGPYPGLRSFKRDESEIFFGRDEQIDELVERLTEDKFLAVVGESGCGKSSLVRAGLLPALGASGLRDTTRPWAIAEMRPGDQPMRELARALLEAQGRKDAPAEEVNLLIATLSRGPFGLEEALTQRGLHQRFQLLLLVDQFEELIRFRRSGSTEADAFVALLLATAESELPVRIVLTLRTDYLGKCAVFRRLPQALTKGQYLTPLLTREQLREAIVFPARAFGGDVDEELANHIINEVGKNQDLLPVVQHALMWMWSLTAANTPTPSTDSRAEHQLPRELTLAAFRDLGGLGDVLSKHASTVYGTLSPQQQWIARRMFCALWEEGDRTSDNRRPCPVGVVAQVAGVALDELIAVADRFRAAEHCFILPLTSEGRLDQASVLDVSHESLFRHWCQLANWTAQEAKDAEEFRDWRHRAAGRKAGRLGLLTGDDLKTAKDWQQRVKPTPQWVARYQREEGDYSAVLTLLEESQHAEEKAKAEKAAAEQRTKAEKADAERRRRSLMVVNSALLLACAIIAIVWAFRSRLREATQELATRDHFAAAASTAGQREPALGLQLALQATVTGATTGSNPSSHLAVLRAALRRSRFRALIVPSLGSFQNARLLAGNQQAVTIGSADGLAFWSIPDGRRIGALFGQEPSPSRLAVSSDGLRAYTAGDTGCIDVWDLSTRKLIATLHGQAVAINELALSPDGSRLASASDDGAARLWSVSELSLVQTFWGHLGKVSSVAFTHDGERLVTAGEDQQIILWEVSSGRKLRSLSSDKKKEAVKQLAVSPTGGILAGVQDDVTLWDPVSQKLIGHVAHTNRVTGVVFNGDGRRMASAGFDGAIRVWEADTKDQLLEIFDEPSLLDPAVNRATPALGATRQGDPAASSGSGASGGVSTAPAPEPEPLSNHDRLSAMGARTIHFSPDGSLIITTGWDGIVKIWSVYDQEELPASWAHEGAVSAIAPSHSGRQLATVGGDGAVVLWDWQSPGTSERGAPFHQTFRTTVYGARVVAFSGDDRLLATNEVILEGENAGVNVVLWAVEDGRLKRTASFAAGLRAVKAVAFYSSADAPRLLAAAGDEVVVWDLRISKELFRLKANLDVRATAVSPDQQMIATECRANAEDDERRICLWRADTGEPVAVWQGPGGEGDTHMFSILAMAFSRDGSILVTAGKDKVARIWDVARGELRGQLLGHSETLQDIAVSPDGTLVATAAEDSFRLWGLPQYTSFQGFPNAEPGGVAVAFAADGKYVVAGGRDGILRTYPIDPIELVPLALERTPLALGPDACTRYAGEACLAQPTPEQRANAERFALRRTETNVATESAALDTSERSRFGSARAFDAAADVTIAPLQRAIVEVDAQPGNADATIAALVERCRAAAGEGIAAGAPLFRQAHLMDATLPSADVHPEVQVLSARLMQFARVLAERGLGDAVREILELVPGRQPGWATTAAQDVLWTGILGGSSAALAQNDDEEAIRLLNSVEFTPDDPRYFVWLRAASKAYRRSHDSEIARALIQQVANATNDADVLIEQAALLPSRSDDYGALLRRARAIDPMNDDAALMLGAWYFTQEQWSRALTVLLQVSPQSESYRPALQVAGPIAFDKLGRTEDGYRWMAAATQGREPGDWANLAEANLAMGRLLEARLFALRVLEAKVVDAADPSSQLAMWLVVTSSWALERNLNAARSALGSLGELIEAGSVKTNDWSYTGIRHALGTLPAAQARFPLALIDYCESAGKNGSLSELQTLLKEIPPA